MSDDGPAHRPALWSSLETVSKAFAPASVALIVIEPGEVHIQVEVPDTEDPARIYAAGQKALYALATFLERMRPMVEASAEASADRKAQVS